MAKSKFRVIISTLLLLLCFNTAKAADADELLAWIDMPENAAAKAFLTDPARGANKVWTAANVANLGSWFGITANNGSVTQIYFSENNSPNGFVSIPDLNLPNLITLHIMSYNPVQNIPLNTVANFTHLTALQTLRIQSNSTTVPTTLNATYFPALRNLSLAGYFSDISAINLPALTNLEIASPNLTSTSLSPINTNHPNLQALYIGGVCQTGDANAPIYQLPKFNLPALTKLSVYFSKLGVAPDISLLPALSELYLVSNELGINGALIPDYTAYTNLTKIDLYGNYYNFASFASLPLPYINRIKTTYYVNIGDQKIQANTLKLNGGIYTATPGSDPATTTYTWTINPAGGGSQIVYSGLGSNGYNVFDPTNPGSLAPVGSTVVLNISSPDWYYSYGTPLKKYDMRLSGSFIVGQPLFLPVNFDDVTATIKSGKLFVKWATLTETNNSHFDVEVSKDGKTFTKLTTLQSKAMGGNSTQKADYEVVTDLQNALAVMGIPALLALLGIAATQGKKRRFSAVIFGVVVLTTIAYTSCSKSKEVFTDSKYDVKLFVRIKQVDKDGSFKYSKVVQAVNE